jgi:carboxyl-terminal processing protease
MYISDFRDNTLEEVVTALEEFKQLDTLALILDLRNNPGGSLESARQIASQFLSQGLFMYEVDKAGARSDQAIEAGGIATEAFMFKAEEDGAREDLMVVLVNEFTGNAAEALAGSLQDAHRADILGIRTVGRGSDNVYRELSDGSAIYLPVSNWYTPSGRRITGSGILPDIEVPIRDEDRALGLDTQRDVASEYLDNQLPQFR